MASTLVTTIGSASANSYVTLDEAASYFADRVGGESWADVGDVQARALLTACKRLDRLNWLGSRVTTTQALAWPRYGVQKPDGTASIGYGIADYYLTTEIPQPVKDAQCELAFALMAGHTEGADKIKRWKADDVEIEYDSSGASGSFPPEVDQLIGALVGGVRVVRG